VAAHHAAPSAPFRDEHSKVSAALRVAYAGEPGAFAEDALIAYFGEAVTSLPVGSFGAVREAILDGRADAGVLPIENVVNGTVRETLDLLRDGALQIVGEAVVPVHLVVAALPGVSLAEVLRIYSHAQALAQAEGYLKSRDWTLLTTYNTAGAGAMIRERRERDAAALLSPRAATLHGLTPLTGPVEGSEGNRTRFWILQRAAGAATRRPARADASNAATNRTTLLVGVKNEPGTLLAVLAQIASAGLNMSKLESRPSAGSDWEYVFWVDLDAGEGDPALAAALEGLRGVTTELRLLGSYPRATEPASRV
jgi:prephenate dehydratase